MKFRVPATIAFFVMLSSVRVAGPGLAARDLESGPPQGDGVVAVVCGWLVDVTTDRVLQGAVVLIRGGRINSIGPRLPIPAGARVIDLGQMTVLPGLIDTHTHLTYHYDQRGNERPASVDQRCKLRSVWSCQGEFEQERAPDRCRPIRHRRPSYRKA